MRFMKVLMIGTLIITCGSALGEEFRNPPAEISVSDPSLRPTVPAMTTLQISPLYLEIKAVLDHSARQEKALLQELAAATEEYQCQLIIGRIERLDLKRDLDIMGIQAEHAHKSGRWGLEKQIRQRILDLEKGGLVATR